MPSVVVAGNEVDAGTDGDVVSVGGVVVAGAEAVVETAGGVGTVSVTVVTLGNSGNIILG